MVAAWMRVLTPDCVVVVGDGAGAPREALTDLAEAARSVGGIRLVVGWSFDDWSVVDDPDAFSSVRTIMGGYGMRRLIRDGRVGYVPSRMGAMPALLAGPLRPDVALVSLSPRAGSLHWPTEASWMPAAVEHARHVVVEVRPGLAATGAEPPLERGRIDTVVESGEPPPTLDPATLDDESLAIGDLVANLIPEGASVQVGPGKIGEATLARLRVPVRIDSGVLNDAVVDLDARGLLLGTPSTAYVIGTEVAYEWADGRSVSRRVEYTHDLSRLSGSPLYAVNTALEIDRYGQVNVERIGDNPLGGIGGHGDYAVAASRATHGLSIIALPRARGGHSTLVDQLSAPTSTGYADVDVVVCEAGAVDLRGMDCHHRARAVEDLWQR